MLAENVKAWRKQWMAEGRVAGRIEGMAESLIQLLTKRFGEVTPACLAKIHGADLTTLRHWIRRGVVAPDLASVFDPPR